MYHVLVAVDNCHEDVIHRSLQGTYPEYFVKPHHDAQRAPPPSLGVMNALKPTNSSIGAVGDMTGQA